MNGLHAFAKEITLLTTQIPQVLFVPDGRGGNPYQDLLAAGIRATGTEVGFADYPDTLFPLLNLARSHPGVRVIHLHWVPEYIGRILWSSSHLKGLLRTVLLILDVLMVRLRRVKLVWTVHNRLSHESTAPQREIMARRTLARVVTRLVFHSTEARISVEKLLAMPLAGRSVVIPHGNYLGMYPADPGRERQLRERLGLGNGDKVILFFGALRGYKGIDQLLAAFHKTHDSRLRLIIAGKPFEPDIAADIEKAAAANPRISPYLGFIPDADVGPLYAIAHLAIIPFERTLTSGSAILAMSQGKALLLPEEARVLGLPDYRGVLFFDQTSGLQAALNCLPDVVQLQAMGRTNLEIARKLDWSMIGQKTVAAYGCHLP